MGARVRFEQHLKWGSYWAGAMLPASHFAQCAVCIKNYLIYDMYNTPLSQNRINTPHF